MMRIKAMIWQTRENLELYLRDVKGKNGESIGGIRDGGGGGSSGSGADVGPKLYPTGGIGAWKLCSG